MTGSNQLPRKMSMDHLTRSPRMTPDEYQDLAFRTECDHLDVTDRLKAACTYVPLMHAVIGISGEAGELSSAMEKYAFYNQELDRENVKEELGDLMWYIAEACNALGISLQDVMEANIRKLRSRYPEKFDHVLAREENRDRDKEAEALYHDQSEKAARRFYAEDNGVIYDGDDPGEIEISVDLKPKDDTDA